MIETMRKGRGSRRDVMFHVAVTIMPTQDKIAILGEQENEITQLAVDIPFNKTPMTEVQFRAAMFALCEKALQKSRAAGLIRS